MNDGVSSAFLALGLQSLLCTVLVWIFSEKKETPGFWRVILCSLLLPPTAIATEFAVGGFLREGTLLFVGVLFALLLHTLAKLRLLSAFGAVFCLLSLSLGGAVFQHHRMHHSETAEEERLLRQGFDGEDSSDSGEGGLPEELLESRLDQRLLLARNHLREFLYAGEPALPPPPPPPSVMPTPLPPLELPAPPNMRGEDFALLFGVTPDVEPSPLPTPVAPPSPTRRPGLSTPTGVSPFPSVPLIDANRLNEMAKVRNISVDPRFPAPSFEIGLVGMGSAGGYAMVNGTLIRIGSILRGSGGTPPAWKLVNLSATELYWQPVE